MPERPFNLQETLSNLPDTRLQNFVRWLKEQPLPQTTPLGEPGLPKPNPETIERCFSGLRGLAKQKREGKEVNPNDESDIQRQLSDTLNLPADKSFRTVEDLEEQAEDINRHSPKDNLRWYSNNDPAFFQRIFAQATGELPAALAKYQEAVEISGQSGTYDYQKARDCDTAADTLQDLYDQAAGIKPEELEERGMTGRNFRRANETFEELLEQEQASPEDFVTAFGGKNTAEIAHLRIQNSIFARRGQFLEGLAAKGGIRIISADLNLGRFIWLDSSSILQLDTVTQDRVQSLFAELREEVKPILPNDARVQELKDQISDALHLPEEVNSRTVQQEEVKQQALDERYICSGLDHKMEKNPEIFERLFKHASPQLQTAFAEYQQSQYPLSG